MADKEYIAFLEDKILAYDKELQRIEKEAIKLETKVGKMQKELIETRFELNNAKKIISEECQS